MSQQRPNNNYLLAFVHYFFDKMFEIFKKASQQHNIMSDFKRLERKKRYYQRHKDEIKQKRREYYATYGK